MVCYKYEMKMLEARHKWKMRVEVRNVQMDIEEPNIKLKVELTLDSKQY